jgi:hypothetical protein
VPAKQYPERQQRRRCRSRALHAARDPARHDGSPVRQRRRIGCRTIATTVACMKKIAQVAIGVAATALVPLGAHAQTVPFNTSSTIQQSFLAELQSLQQELASLEATVSAMIVAAGGSLPPATAPSTAASQPSSPALPAITPTTLTPSGSLSGEGLTSALLQAITPATTTASFANPATANGSASNPGAAAADQNIGTQFNPACIAGLWANGALCGGLYYCSAGGGYWSTTSCPAVE